MKDVRLNIHEAKTHLSRYLKRLTTGGRIILCRRNMPVAEIRPLAQARRRKARPIGLEKGRFTVPPAFFEPLPEEILDAFS